MKTEAIQRVLRALDDIRRGRMVIMVDDEDRENEGDLVMAAQHVTPEAINFMATHGRGLICLTLTDERVSSLELPMMVDGARGERSTAFTVSIEAREGVSTGISAADRAHTIRVAVAPGAKAYDLTSPGHVFPLRARPGGILQRSGHTEGSVDLARLAGCDPSGVICEIMKDDGTMARQDDLRAFAETHNLTIVAIADLIEYRLQTERMVRRVKDGEVNIFGHTFRASVYASDVEARQFLALSLGELTREPTLVRVQTGSVLGDVFDVEAGDRLRARQAAARIADEGRGVILFMLPERMDLARDLAIHLGEKPSRGPVDQGKSLREFGLGAQVLADLGLCKIRILTNRPRRIVGLEGYGLEVVDQLALDATNTGENN